jgi:hypothetical protein
MVVSVPGAGSTLGVLDGGDVGGEPSAVVGNDARVDVVSDSSVESSPSVVVVGLSAVGGTGVDPPVSSPHALNASAVAAARANGALIHLTVLGRSKPPSQRVNKLRQ